MAEEISTSIEGNAGIDTGASNQQCCPRAYFSEPPIRSESILSMEAFYAISLLFSLNLVVNLICIWCTLADQYSIKPSGCSAFDTSKWPSSAAYDYYGVHEGVSLPVPSWFVGERWIFQDMLKICPQGAIEIEHYENSEKVKGATNARCIFDRNSIFENIDADNAAAGVSTHLASSWTSIETARSLIFAASVVWSCLLPFILCAWMRNGNLWMKENYPVSNATRFLDLCSWMILCVFLVLFGIVLGTLVLVYVGNDLGNPEAWETTWFSGCDEIIVSNGSAFGVMIYLLVSIGVYICYCLLLQYEGVMANRRAIERTKREKELYFDYDIELEIGDEQAKGDIMLSNVAIDESTNDGL